MQPLIEISVGLNIGMIDFSIFCQHPPILWTSCAEPGTLGPYIFTIWMPYRNTHLHTLSPTLVPDLHKAEDFIQWEIKKNLF